MSAPTPALSPTSGEIKCIMDNILYDRDGIPTNLSFKLRVDQTSEFIPCLRPNWDFSTYEYKISIPDIITPLSQEDILNRLKAGKSILVMPKTTYGTTLDDGSVIFKDSAGEFVLFYNWRCFDEDGITYWDENNENGLDFWYDSDENMNNYQFIDGDPFYKIIPGVL